MPWTPGSCNQHVLSLVLVLSPWGLEVLLLLIAVLLGCPKLCSAHRRVHAVPCTLYMYTLHFAASSGDVSPCGCETSST